MTQSLPPIRFDAQGLVAAVVQEFNTREILMVAYMTQATLDQTLSTRLMTYWSRSRRCVWVKGATSGQFQEVQRAHLDCDGDALLFEVVQRGSGACHTGARTCFHQPLQLSDEHK
ncbi:MAG: phosphoribosyl-AMP cyclohydrolase [Bacteroidota bacterium]|nr:phosphoribosyl-AMP cyclohydrolase [Bacteroidota bacterium]MDE2834571.1 phosphoribosyl-AMP cyclohydrolase [Bacteroidota bacterium]MDE2957036.1 phosphoribosyl-AMP cyclohydrolase [Bacteroidota bacterium]